MTTGSSTRRLVSRVGVTITGSLLIALGIVGLFLPVLPGVVFLVGGLAFLAREYTWAERLVESARDRFRSVTHQSTDQPQRPGHP